MSFYKIRPRSGTAAQWSSANTVLGEREIGFEVPAGGVGTGAIKMKMGDGTTPWNSLPYAIIPNKEVEGTFTPNFTPGSGSNLTVKQIGRVVYLSGVLKRNIPFGYDDFGTISGVDVPLQSTDISVVSYVDNYETIDDIHAGWVSISVDQGTIKLTPTINPIDNNVTINGFYFVN